MAGAAARTLVAVGRPLAEPLAGLRRAGMAVAGPGRAAVGPRRGAAVLARCAFMTWRAVGSRLPRGSRCPAHRARNARVGSRRPVRGSRTRVEGGGRRRTRRVVARRAGRSRAAGVRALAVVARRAAGRAPLALAGPCPAEATTKDGLRADRRVGLEALDRLARDRMAEDALRCRAASGSRRRRPARRPCRRRRPGRCGRCDGRSPRGPSGARSSRRAAASRCRGRGRRSRWRRGSRTGWP